MTLNTNYTNQISLALPKDTAMKYQYGLLNNTISLNVPIKDMNLNLKLNIKIDEVFGGNIEEISIDAETFENTIKKWLIKQLKDELTD